MTCRTVGGVETTMHIDFVFRSNLFGRKGREGLFRATECILEYNGERYIGVSKTDSRDHDDRFTGQRLALKNLFKHYSFPTTTKEKIWTQFFISSRKRLVRRYGKRSVLGKVAGESNPA